MINVKKLFSQEEFPGLPTHTGNKNALIIYLLLYCRLIYKTHKKSINQMKRLPINSKKIILFSILTFSTPNSFAATEDAISTAPMHKRPILNYICDCNDPLKSHEWLATHSSFKKGQDFLKALKTDQTTPPPEKHDIRDILPKGSNFTVNEQRAIGSCTAQSAAGAVEFNLWKETRSPTSSPMDPSPLFIYFNTRLLMGTLLEDSGASLATTIRSLMMFGTCAEDNWKYENETDKFLIPPTPDCYIRARKYVNLDDFTLASIPQDDSKRDIIKALLSKNIPVVFGFKVYKSFSPDKDGRIPTPTKAERADPALYLGDHAVMMVGYDDENELFTIRNSWGASWGKNGYFRMPYKYVLNPDLAWDFWSLSQVGPGKTPLDTISNQILIPLIEKMDSAISEIKSLMSIVSSPSQAMGYALSIPSRAFSYAWHLPSRALQYSFSIPKRVVLSLLAPFSTKSEEAGSQTQKI